MVTTTSSTGDTNITYTYGGFDPFFINWKRINSAFDDIFRTTTDKFPAYNIRKIDENKAVIELAIAGYAESDIDITEHDNTITITGDRKDEGEYLYKGIAGRKFTRNFVLGDYMEVTGAELKDGILYIGVSRNVPEEKMPKKVTIGNLNQYKYEVANKNRKKLL